MFISPPWLMERPNTSRIVPPGKPRASLGMMINRARRILRRARLCPSWPGSAPPGFDCSLRALSSVYGSFDAFRDVLSDRCSRSTNSISSLAQALEVDPSHSGNDSEIHAQKVGKYIAGALCNAVMSQLSWRYKMRPIESASRWLRAAKCCTATTPLLHLARLRALHDNSFKLTIQTGFVQACCAGRHWTSDGDACRDHRNRNADRTEKSEFAHISLPSP